MLKSTYSYAILQVATSHRLREKERRTNPRNEELDQAKSNNSSYFKNLLYSCVFSSVSSQRVNPPNDVKSYDLSIRWIFQYPVQFVVYIIRR